MADDGDEPGKTVQQTDVFQHPAHDSSHLQHVKTDERPIGKLFVVFPFKTEVGRHPFAGDLSRLAGHLGSQPWKGHPRHQRHCGQRPADGCQQAPAEERATATGHAPGQLPHPPSHCLPHAVVGGGPIFRHLHHSVRGLDHDRTQRRGVPVIHPLVVHRHRKKPCRAEGLIARVQFLKMPAKRLAALIDAEDGLQARRGRPIGGHAGVAGEGIQNLDAVPPLVGEMKQPAPGHIVKRLDRALEAEDVVLFERPHVVRRQPDQPRHLADEKSAGHTARPGEAGMPVP